MLAVRQSLLWPSNYFWWGSLFPFFFYACDGSALFDGGFANDGDPLFSDNGVGCVKEGNIAATALGCGMYFVQVEKDGAEQLDPLHGMIGMFGWA
jgi:hypothetical protein